MDLSREATDVFECGTCGNVGIGDGDIGCCGGTMEPTGRESGDEDTGPSGPSLDELLRTVFDMSDTELDICLCVMEGGDLTVEELAEQTGYDRSNVSRHLNHLADLGVVEKRRRLLRQGGHEYVYVPEDVETVRESLGRQFAVWVAGARRSKESSRAMRTQIPGGASTARSDAVYRNVSSRPA
jgi:predicted transcriptional regulator